MFSRRLLPILSACAILLVAGPAAADLPNQDDVCASPEATTDKYKHLRALSLELRGHPPTAQEYEELAAHDDVPQAWLDEWLSSQEFAERTVRWHRSLLWNNIRNENILSVNSSLGRSNNIYFRSGSMAQRLRGRNVACLNQPATFDASGEPVMTTQSDGSRREGYVMVSPYWAPETQIRVCALDARERMLSESGTPCGQRVTSGDLSCGCGPNMIWCGTGTTRVSILESMNQQIEMLIRDMITESRSYLSLFDSQELYVNGPIAHYWRHQVNLPNTINNAPTPIDLTEVPQMRFDDDESWVKINAGPQHAGVLTMPAYLLRFQTNRARANQFYTKFLCQPFQPPPNGIQADEDSAKDQPDLQERDGCKYCHALLEPAASYWGRWPERGAGYLSPETYPSFSESCQECAETGRNCSDQCSRYYVRNLTDDAMRPWAGYLNSYLWRAEKHEHHIEQGPKLLAVSAVADGRLTACMARRTAENLFGRALTAREDAELVPELAQHFARTDYSYPELVRAIVTSPAYRRVR